jgi:glycerol-3-phosphate dehydrogenase
MPSRRDAALAALAAASDVDVLIIGGGVHGAGTFRDLALQGVSCVLVERDDFAAGASGASTRMAHGGIRYLERGDVRLVREALRERNRLLRNAPHLVEPIQVAIPTKGLWGGLLGAPFRLLRWGRRAAPPGIALLALGLLLYDWLGRRGRPQPKWGAAYGKRARRLLVGAAPQFDGIGWMWDGRIEHPERLVVELVEDGLAAHPGGIAVNHCGLVGREGSEIILRDEFTGATFRIRPRIVINATGAWADKVNRTLGFESSLVSASQGTHLFLDNRELSVAVGARLLYFADAGGRMCILYNIEGCVLLGTTDIPVDDADAASTRDAEIAYLLDAARALFPSIAIDRDQIRFTTCGVRSLRRTDTDIGSASRDYAIHRRDRSERLPFEIFTLVGGKWTTFRAAAESLTDTVLADLGRQRRLSTAALPIGGGRDFPDDLLVRANWISRHVAETGLSDSRIAQLLRRYGTRASRVATFCAEEADRPLSVQSTYTERELRFLIRYEQAGDLEDLLLRRTQIALSGELSIQSVEVVARIVAEESGQSVSASNVAQRLEPLRTRHGMRFERCSEL